MKLEHFCMRTETFLTSSKREKNLSAHTLRAYASDLKQLVAFWQSLEAREKHPVTLHVAVERHFAALHTKKITRSSIARKISCIHSYEKFIELHDHIKLNLQLMRPQVEQKEPLYLTSDELCYLLDALPAERMKTPFPLRDKAIFELLYATGMRCSELVAIRVKDLNFAKKTIHIQPANNAERFVLFGSTCEKKLLDYLAQERMAIKHPAEFLFLNYRQEPLTTRSVQRICALFGSFLPSKRPLTPHILRHSFATHMVRQGADLKTVQTLLGHKTIASTEKYSSL